MFFKHEKVTMQLTLRDAGDLKRLAKQLREHADGKALRKELTGGIRGVLNPVRDRVKAAYRAAPSRGRRGRQGPPLRLLLAKATRVEVRTSGRLAGARIRVDGRRMPDQMKALPAYREGYKRPWRHPVYGNRNVWVAQPAQPVFDRTTQPAADDAARAIERVLDGVRRQLERRVT